MRGNMDPEVQKNVDAATGEPQRFIRTFASDKKVLEEGGKPELAPLSSLPDAPLPQGKPVADLPVMPVLPTNAPPIGEQQETREQIVARLRGLSSAAMNDPKALIDAPLDLSDAPSALDRLVGGSSVSEKPPSPPEPEVVVPPPPPPPVVPEELAPLHTYKSDFSGQMKDMAASTMSVLAAEADAGGVTSVAAPSKPALSSILFTIGGVVLLIASVAGVYFGYQSFAKRQPVQVAQVVSAPIFVDERQEIATTSPLLAELVASVQKPLSQNAVRFVYTEEATSTGKDVFSALKLGAPSIVLRNISAPRSMAGIANIGGNQAPFFILSVASYGDTFSGMLLWEPRMARDLGVLFPAYRAVEVAPPPVASSTASTTPQVPIQARPLGFQDEVVANHDVRILRDGAGRTIMVYGYWNQNTLVIARDEGALSELMNRLATSKTQQ